MQVGESGERFAEELGAAIEQSGLTLTAISQRLRARHRPVSIATLSNWRSGRSLPGGEQSLGVVAALEELLGRDPDSLAELVGGPRLRGRAVRTTTFLGNRSSRQVFFDALQELGFSEAQKYSQERVVHQQAWIDSDSGTQRIDFHLMLKALESGTCRLPAVSVLGPTEPNIAPIFTALAGCSIGRRLVRPEDRAYGVELLVDGRLDAGQVATIAYRVEITAEATDLDSVVYSLPRRANDVLIEAEFRGSRRPVDCERYQRTEAGEVVSPVRLDHRDRLQISEARFGPGTLGLRWKWETEHEDDHDLWDDPEADDDHDPDSDPGAGAGPRR